MNIARARAGDRLNEGEHGMGKDASEIRIDTQDTRSHLSDGVDAVKSAVSDTAARIADAVPSADELRAGADRLDALIKDNPVGVAVGSVAVGFLMGLLLPRTAIESHRLNDVKQMAKDAGAQVVEAGKQMVLDTVSTTLGTRKA